MKTGNINTLGTETINNPSAGTVLDAQTNGTSKLQVTDTAVTSSVPVSIASSTISSAFTNACTLTGATNCKIINRDGYLAIRSDTGTSDLSLAGTSDLSIIKSGIQGSSYTPLSTYASTVDFHVGPAAATTALTITDAAITSSVPIYATKFITPNNALFADSGTYACMWGQGLTPDLTNFSFLINKTGSATILNASSVGTMDLRIGNASRILVSDTAITASVPIIGKYYACNSGIGDEKDGAPWYGVGYSTVPAGGGFLTQLAGYNGVRVRSSTATLDVLPASINASVPLMCQSSIESQTIIQARQDMYLGQTQTNYASSLRGVNTVNEWYDILKRSTTTGKFALTVAGLTTTDTAITASVPLQFSSAPYIEQTATDSSLILNGSSHADTAGGRLRLYGSTSTQKGSTRLGTVGGTTLLNGTDTITEMATTGTSNIIAVSSSGVTSIRATTTAVTVAPTITFQPVINNDTLKITSTAITAYIPITQETASGDCTPVIKSVLAGNAYQAWYKGATLTGFMGSISASTVLYAMAPTDDMLIGSQTAGKFLRVQMAGSDRLTVSNTAVTSYVTLYTPTGTVSTSDIRTKTAIESSPLGLDFILALKPIKYKFIVGGTERRVVGKKDDVVEMVENSEGVLEEKVTVGENIFKEFDLPGKRDHYGFGAQDVEEVLEGRDFGGFVRKEDGVLALRYEEFISPMVKAMQEQQALITSLMKRIELLENK